MGRVIEPEDITFEDVLKNGAKWGEDLLRGFIGRELNNHDKRMRALTSIRIRECRHSKVPDLLKLLSYDRERRSK